MSADGNAPRDEPITSIDAFLNGRMVLEQPQKGHRIGTDAILLAACAPPDRKIIADFGSGVGAVGIAVALMHPHIEARLVENDPAMCALARRNIERNGLVQRVKVAEISVFASEPARSSAGLCARSVDAVLTNPPFFSKGTGRPSPIAQRRNAHIMQDGNLDDWLRAAAFALRPSGAIVLIHRAEAVGETLAAMQGRFGALKLLFLHKSATEPASRVIVNGVLGSKAPLTILPPINLHETGGAFTDAAAALHRGQGHIDWQTGAVELIDRASLINSTPLPDA